MMALTRVYFEEAKNSVFAVALDWPGWCRRAKTLDLALESLEHYRDRYASVVTKGFTQGRTEIVATLRGDVTTAFGAPSQFGPWDLEPLSPRELNRHVEILETCWAYFDQVVETAPAELRKGPRGGGRDRDEMVVHVREAERIYCPKFGVRVPPRTPWTEQRDMVVGGLRSRSPGGVWPVRYAIRRVAWHVLDHAWEIEDKSV
jgi:hypothetical protein